MPIRNDEEWKELVKTADAKAIAKEMEEQLGNVLSFDPYHRELAEVLIERAIELLKGM